MARNKDFFVNSAPKRDKSFFVKEDTVTKKENINIDFKPANLTDFVSGVRNKTIVAPAKTSQPIAPANLGEAYLHRANMTTEDIRKQNQESTEWRQKSLPEKIGTGVGKAVATPVAAFAQLGTGTAQGLEGAMDFGTSAGVTGINAARDRRIQKIEKEIARLKAQGKGNSSIVKALEEEREKAINARDTSNKIAEEFVGKQWVQDYVGNSVDEFTEKYSYLPEKAGQITKTVGNMLPSIANAGSIAKSLPQATTKLGQLATKGATMLPFMAQAAGSSTEQALNEGANLADATKYGIASGVIEGVIESAFGGIGGSVGGKIASSALGKEVVERIAKNAFGKYALKLADAGIDVFGEGFEEVLSTAINPYIQRMTYDEKAKLATSEEMMQSFIDGVLASLLVKGGQAGLSRVTNRNNANVQENEAQNQPQTQNIEQPNVTLPNQVETAQNVNTEQITQIPNLPTQKAQETLQSAKIAGMTDMDMQKAKELNDMLRSGTRLKFYDPQNIPQGVDVSRAADANGFYTDGTLWINKNSKMKVERILGHELTHHVENDDLINTILDSNIFYDFLSEKGFSNTAEFKKYLMEKKGYKQEELTSEMVAHFAEEKLFGKEETINRLARENRTLAQKILNWLSDLKTKIAGSTEAKELLKIENMYRKALDQARNTATFNTADVKYHIKNIADFNETEYNNIQEMQLSPKEYGKLAHIVDTDPSIKPGINRVSTSDATYVIYQKEYNDFKVVDKYEGGVENDTIANGNIQGVDNARDGRSRLQVPIDNIRNEGTAKSNDELLNRNTRARSVKVESDNDGISNKKSVAGKEPAFSMPEIKEKQLKIILETNPMNDDYHVGIRNIDDIKTFDEVIDDDESFVWGDFSREDAQEALEKGEIKVYSSKEIKDGNFVSTSYNQARDYAGNGKVYSKIVPLEDVAWISGDEGQYAKVTETDKVSFSLPETDNQGRTLSKEQQEFFEDSKLKDEKGNLISYYHGTQNGGFNTFEQGKQKGAGKALGEGFYFTQSKSQAQTYASTEESINKSRELLGLPKKEATPQVYEVYLNAKNPLYLSEYKGELVDKADYIAEKYLNMDTKNDMYRPYKDYAESKLETAISMIDYIKSVSERSGKTTAEIFKDLGYDALVDGKFQTVVFEPNQIKNIDNTNPTENPDIRYSMNPVEVAKNPPNIETGLDQLKRTSRVKEGDTQSNFTKNIYNQSIFDDKFKDLALDDKNIRSYASISNKETLQEANDAINEQGQKWVDRFLDKPNGEMKATDIAGGFILMNRYQQAGDYESMIRIAEKLRKAGTQQGQTIQMFSVLGRMTPEGMTYYAQKELSKAYDEILKNKTQKWADEHADEFKLNEKDIEYIQRRVNQAARLPEGRDKYVLLGEIASRIQNKIPPQAGQGLKALARNSMLLNPKTMVRNILGNVVIVPNHIISDFVGSGIDKAISKKTGVRTTGGFDVKALQGAKKGVYESFDDFRRNISTREMGGDRFEIGQGKNFYENHTGRFAETRNKINKALNGLDRVTGFLLETGDRPFYETWFINSLNNQMKLNNVTEPTAEMIEIATDEALQRTWQDNNTYTKFVNSIRKGMNNLNVKGYGLGDIVMPFVKTPANLTKAVVDFSPLGAINAAIKTSQFNRDIGKGVATTKQQREVVKAWSQVITGTLGMAIMAGLAEAGILGGGSDEDKDVRAFEQNVLGIKPYSIKIGDKSYTYDWAQPLGTSAAMVADTVKSLKNAKDTEGKVAAILEGAQSGASVLLEQSFVSGIRNLFEEDNLINALIETGLNEPSKFTPQFLSQVAQIQDDTARTSYVYNNPLQTAKNKIKAKIPGLRETLEPSVDVLGREVKTDNSVGNVMFNPTNTAAARTTEGAEEMYRVYKATGDKTAIAQVAPYYFNVGSEKIVLTPKQRTQYQKTIGQIASDGVENLIDNKAYKNLSDSDKAEILSELYSYGNAVAKEEATTKYLMPKDMQKIKASGMKPEEYILAKHISNSGGSKKEELYHALTSSGYSPKQAEGFLSYYKGYKFENTTNNALPTLKQQRAKLPTLKK